MLRIAQLLRSLISILITTAAEGVEFLRLAVSSRAELSAEVLFLRKQLAFLWNPVEGERDSAVKPNTIPL